MKKASLIHFLHIISFNYAILSTTFSVVLFGLKFVLVLRICFNYWLLHMARKGKGTIYQHVKGKMYVYIHATARDDSTFPFKPGEKVMVSINKDKLTVEKDKLQ